MITPGAVSAVFSGAQHGVDLAVDHHVRADPLARVDAHGAVVAASRDPVPDADEAVVTDLSQPGQSAPCLAVARYRGCAPRPVDTRPGHQPSAIDASVRAGEDLCEGPARR
jgi:hypothetical protein